MGIAGAAHIEFRRYDVAPGGMEVLLRRFEETTLPIWADVGIRPLAFWQTDVGRANTLQYLLGWDDLGQRASRLEAFRTDPRWIEGRERTYRDGSLVRQIDTELWVPSRLSAAT